MSGIYDVTLAAGAAANLGVLGSYVKVYSAPEGAVQLKLDGGDGYTLLAGQGFRLPDLQSFRDVQVKNLAAASQTIKVFIGDARFEDSRITGDVVQIDAVSSSCRTDLYAPSLAVGVFAATAIIAPGANLNGLLIRTTRVAARAAGGGTCAIYLIAAPTAPLNANGGAQQYLAAVVADTAGTAEVQIGQFDLKKRIPAGWGLYGAITVSVAGPALAGGAIVCTEAL